VAPLDKAGAYAAQGNGAEIIAKIDGSFTNVVGLPMKRRSLRWRNSAFVRSRSDELS
jgi:septum formation protein